MEILDLIQWPAMLISLIAAWLVGSLSKRRRKLGFWLFLASNFLWIVWGWHDHAYALIFLQICMAVMNLRGIFKNEPETATQ